MEFDLCRVDYVICGVTFPNTLKLLPAGSNEQHQKFVVGDKGGVLQCLGVKNEEITVQFKSLPGKEITCVQLGGAPGTPADKIFTASGNEIKGYTRKGKVFLAMETALSEAITSMCVSGGDLIIASGKTITHYRDLVEMHTYICEDRVIDVVIFGNIRKTSKLRLLAVLANKTAIILEEGKERTRVYVPAGATRLMILEDYPACFYGANDGSIGTLEFDKGVLSWREWVSGGEVGGVMCLGRWGGLVAAGRQDGGVLLYRLLQHTAPHQLHLLYTGLFGERVTSVCGGLVCGEGEELMVALYSGRVFGLRQRHLAPANTQHLTARKEKLSVEVARLEKQVSEERTRYQRSTHATLATLSAPPLLDTHIEVGAVELGGWRPVVVSSAAPLDVLVLHGASSLDVETDSAAVLSLPPKKSIRGEGWWCVVRCQAGGRRTVIRLRNVNRSISTPFMAMTTDVASVNNRHTPGSKTDLRPEKIRLYVASGAAPRLARLHYINLPVLYYLALHHEKEDETREYSTLTISGVFSGGEISTWLSVALDHVTAPAPVATCQYKHVLLDTIMIATYQKGLAIFKSDDVTTLATLKELLSELSVEKNVRVGIACDLVENCALKSLKKIEPVLRKEYEKLHQSKLRKALRALELEDNSNEVALCGEYKAVLSTSHDESEMYFEEMAEAVVAWFSDEAKLRLRPTQAAAVALLREAVLRCDLEAAIGQMAQKTAATESHHPT